MASQERQGTQRRSVAYRPLKEELLLPTGDNPAPRFFSFFLASVLLTNLHVTLHTLVFSILTRMDASLSLNIRKSTTKWLEKS